MEKLCERLLKKSKEAFLIALEIYNKPLIKYRAETFSIILCNAWELLFKAYIVKKEDEKSIYYKDKPNRTISITDALKKVLTNKNDWVRKNIEEIIELRNKSCHLMIDEIDNIYYPLFQANVLNYINLIYKFFDIKQKDLIENYFLVTKPEMFEFNLKLLSEKYDKNSYEFLNNLYKRIEKNKLNPKYVISFETKLIRDESCKYQLKDVLNDVNSKLKSLNINVKLTKHSIGLVIKHFNIKNNKKYSFLHEIGKYRQYTYSKDSIIFIVNEFKKDNKLLEKIQK